MRAVLRALGYIAPIAFFVAVGATVYTWQVRRHSTPAPEPSVLPSLRSAVAAAPLHPVEDVDAQDDETPASGSDPASGARPAPKAPAATLEDALVLLCGQSVFQSLFNSDDLVRRIVVTVDNLTRSKQPTSEMSPLVSPDSEFSGSGRGNSRTIGPRDEKRYLPYVRFLSAINMRHLAATYRRFYPLFQTAYGELGTRAYFNDRVIEVIDDLLSTPEPEEPIRISRSSARYRFKFVDDSFESRPSGQKLLLRIGLENERAIKVKLQELRSALTKGHSLRTRA